MEIPWLFEYKKHFVNCPKALIANKMGMNGWEMVDVKMDESAVLYTFKKRVVTNNTEIEK